MIGVHRPWAFWRRVQYVSGLVAVILLVFGSAYFEVLYSAPMCFDGKENGSERGIDCGGDCVRICEADVLQPLALWARAFRIVDGQYNAVAYIENKNRNVGAEALGYTFSLYDQDGLITERSGETVLPPDSVYPIFEGRIDTGARVPIKTTVALEGAGSWLPATAGREQFVVMDRELASADGSPRLDAAIRNTDFEEVLDVEVVATIFDVRGNALTASRTIVPIFPGEATRNVIFTWPEPIAKTVRSCEVPTDVVLAIDLSGSMNNDGGDPPEPISSVLDAAGAFVSRLNDLDQVGVVTYATAAQMDQMLTGDTKRVVELLADLSIAPEEEVGSTNTGDAIRVASDELSSPRHSADARKVLVLLTDGLANEPGEDPEGYAQSAADALKDTGTQIFTIGLGEDVNETFLRGIASDGNKYFPVPSIATIDRIYRSITAEICEDGAAVIEIIPKTGASFQRE